MTWVQILMAASAMLISGAIGYVLLKSCSEGSTTPVGDSDYKKCGENYSCIIVDDIPTPDQIDEYKKAPPQFEWAAYVNDDGVETGGGTFVEVKEGKEIS